MHQPGGAAEIDVTGLSGLLADAQTPLSHGAAKHTNITRELFIPATNDIHASATVNQFNAFWSCVTFVDDRVVAIYQTFKVPDDFVSFISLKCVWATPAAAGNMSWKMGCHWAAHGEIESTHTEYPGTGQTASGGADIIVAQEPPTPLNLANLALGDYVGAKMVREGDDVLGTINDIVEVLGILFTYTANQ